MIFMFIYKIGVITSESVCFLDLKSVVNCGFMRFRLRAAGVPNLTSDDKLLLE